MYFTSFVLFNNLYGRRTNEAPQGNDTSGQIFVRDGVRDFDVTRDIRGIRSRGDGGRGDMVDAVVMVVTLVPVDSTGGRVDRYRGRVVVVAVVAWTLSGRGVVATEVVVIVAMGGSRGGGCCGHG